MLRKFKSISPILAERVYVDSQATVIGDVMLGDDVSIWPGVVIRGDVNSIKIGTRTNVQDNSVCHVEHKSDFNPDGQPLIIGDDVTIGHKVMLHGCTIGDRCLIGMGSIILDGAIVESEVLLGAGSLVPQKKVLESGYLYLGSPVKKIRPLTDDEKNHFLYSAKHYVKLKEDYLND
jgi:carbonic anhydrase/acetyltransferase-like protein (isoleucine patch superfamily)